MQVVYKNRSLQKICTDFYSASKKYGYRMSELIFKRVFQLQAAKTVEDLIKLRAGRCHVLKGQRKGQYAMDLVHPYRLIFEKLGDVIQIARIVEIVDYH